VSRAHQGGPTDPIEVLASRFAPFSIKSFAMAMLSTFAAALSGVNPRYPHIYLSTLLQQEFYGFQRAVLPPPPVAESGRAARPYDLGPWSSRSGPFSRRLCTMQRSDPASLTDFASAPLEISSFMASRLPKLRQTLEESARERLHICTIVLNEHAKRGKSSLRTDW